MEQILPCTEDGPDPADPRDFYAPDSPVLDEDCDLGLDLYESAEEFMECVDPEIQGNDQGESSNACHVWFSYLTCTTKANWRETSPTTSGHTVFTNRPAFVVPTDVAFAATNNFCSFTVTS